MNILFHNITLLPMTASLAEEEKYFEASVGVRGNRIAMVTRDEAEFARFREACCGDLREVDGRGKLLMPGLINTHCHVAMTLMRGYADDIQLMEWLNNYIWPYEALIDRNDVQLGAELGIVEMLRGGVTTFVDMYWYEEAVADAAEKLGIRAVLSPCFVDDRMAAFEEDLPATVAKAEKCDRLSVMIAPHAPYSCSEENMHRAAELSEEYGLPITIHLAETHDEERQIRERFGCSPVELIDRYGLLKEGTIAAHCVHLSDSDRRTLLERGVSVAHNPQSNMKISSGIAPVATLLDEGVNATIATDGPCSNNDLDMWEEMRSASFLQKLSAGDPCVIPAYELLRMATVGGAKAIGRGDELGQIKEGMLADVIVLDMEKPHLYPRYDVVANLAYAAKASDVDMVVVNGEVLVDGGDVLGVDEMDLCRRVEKRAKELDAMVK